MLENETYLSVGREQTRYNRLFLQSTASNKREFIGQIISGQESLLQTFPTPLDFSQGDRRILVIGTHVCKRAPFQGRLQWSLATVVPDVAAKFYLRSFTTQPATESPGQRRGNAAWINFAQTLPPVEFVFDSVDLAQSVLVSKKVGADSRYPDFLVFSSERFEHSWRFDLERTKARNGSQWVRPMPAPLVLDISLLTYLGGLNFAANAERATTLKLPNAKELYTNTVLLSDSEWRGSEYTLRLPDGTAVLQKTEVIFGFSSPEADYFSIFQRDYPVLWTDWHLLHVNDWVSVNASTYKGNLSRVVFIRLRRQ